MKTFSLIICLLFLALLGCAGSTTDSTLEPTVLSGNSDYPDWGIIYGVMGQITLSQNLLEATVNGFAQDPLLQASVCYFDAVPKRQLRKFFRKKGYLISKGELWEFAQQYFAQLLEVSNGAFKIAALSALISEMKEARVLVPVAKTTFPKHDAAEIYFTIADPDKFTDPLDGKVQAMERHIGHPILFAFRSFKQRGEEESDSPMDQGDSAENGGAFSRHPNFNGFVMAYCQL